jgi:hypothetical protein
MAAGVQYPEPRPQGGCAMVVGLGLVVAVLIIVAVIVSRRKD